MLIKGVTIQDLHFGNKRTEEMYKELDFFKEFIKNNEIHILNFNGDYFDRKLTATEPAIFFAINFFDEVMKICIEKNIKVRILLGTRSHDLNQYKTLFSHYFTLLNFDIKYIAEATEEELFGLKILYLPEEYPENIQEYYKTYKTNHYNIIHGHGMWDFVSFVGNIDSEEISKYGGIHSAPIFIYEEWKDAISDGLAIFGHIHKRQSYKNIYYGGPFTAWEYADKSERGFTYYEIDSETKKWELKYINNENCPKFDTIILSDLFKGMDINEVPLEQLQEAITKELAKTDNLKIDFSGLVDEKIKIFRKSFEKLNNIKIDVKKKTKLVESKEPAIYDKYGYILKRELPLNETVQRFISEEFTAEVDLETIKELLT